MKYELWEDKRDNSFTFSTKEGIRIQFKCGALSKKAKKIWEVWAGSWEEAMTKYHEFMGWEPYKPFE